jgi:hypothetical protein
MGPPAGGPTGAAVVIVLGEPSVSVVVMVRGWNICRLGNRCHQLSVRVSQLVRSGPVRSSFLNPDGCEVQSDVQAWTHLRAQMPMQGSRAPPGRAAMCRRRPSSQTSLRRPLRNVPSTGASLARHSRAPTDVLQSTSDTPSTSLGVIDVSRAFHSEGSLGRLLLACLSIPCFCHCCRREMPHWKTTAQSGRRRIRWCGRKCSKTLPSFARGVRVARLFRKESECCLEGLKRLIWPGCDLSSLLVAE